MSCLRDLYEIGLIHISKIGEGDENVERTAEFITRRSNRRKMAISNYRESLYNFRGSKACSGNNVYPIALL